MKKHIFVKVGKTDSNVNYYGMDQRNEQVGKSYLLCVSLHLYFCPYKPLK